MLKNIVYLTGILMIVSFIVLTRSVNGTSAYFSAGKVLSGNTFSTALVFSSGSPTPTPTPSASPTPSSSPTPTETPTAMPSASPTPTSSPIPTPTQTPSSTACPSGTIEISGNGAGSTNTVIITCIDETTINQINLSNINTNINATADTGGNSATGNTGGSTLVVSGSSSTTINVETIVGSNSQ